MFDMLFTAADHQSLRLQVTAPVKRICWHDVMRDVVVMLKRGRRVWIEILYQISLRKCRFWSKRWMRYESMSNNDVEKSSKLMTSPRRVKSMQLIGFGIS